MRCERADIRATIAGGPAGREAASRLCAGRVPPARRYGWPYLPVGWRAVRLSPLMSEHPPAVRFLLVGVVPAVYGAITGLTLGWNEPVYLVLSILGILGGFGAGFDHLGAAAGARRGLIAGSLFGAFILIAHELSGEEPEAHLPEPAILLVVITTVLGVALAAAGGWLRARVERRAKPATRA